jgi:hypothetical protein
MTKSGFQANTEVQWKSNQSLLTFVQFLSRVTNVAAKR